MKLPSKKYKNNSIQSFFYTLMRDYLTPGEVEKIVQDIEKENSKDIIYTNKYLAKYADNISKRLMI